MNILVVVLFLIMVVVWLYQQTVPTPEPVEEEASYDVAKARQYLDSFTPPPRKLTVKPPVKHMLSLAEGGKLVQVYYVLANYPYSPKCEILHIVDLAIMMQLSNGLWINWIFEEVGEVGPEFQLTFRDMRQEFKAEALFRLENVTDSEEWKPLIGMTLSQASPIYSNYDHGAPWLTDLVLQFGEKEITICAIPEPEPALLPEIEDFSLSNDWAVVVFDQELMKKQGRGKFGQSTAMI